MESGRGRGHLFTFFNIQYALNLDLEGQSLSKRTLQRYLELFREDNLAQQVIQDVTAELVRLLEPDVTEHRLDSMHLNSNMARFGRVRLLSTVIRNFLDELKQRNETDYQAITELIRERYGPQRPPLRRPEAEKIERQKN